MISVLLYLALQFLGVPQDQDIRDPQNVTTQGNRPIDGGWDDSDRLKSHL